MAKAAFSIGANLPRLATEVTTSPQETLQQMPRHLLTAFQEAFRDQDIELHGVSSLYQSTPVDCGPDTPVFYNSAVLYDFVDTSSNLDTALEILAVTQAVELEHGRQAINVREHHAPRPLDIDFVFFEDLQCQHTRLTLPHPRAHERLFVLSPLGELLPEHRLPGQKETVFALTERLHAQNSNAQTCHRVSSS